jgi:predicted nucleic acid-binding protein
VIVLLDSGPLGLVPNPNFTPDSEECTQWFERVVREHHVVALPEIIDYELRRELLRGRMTRALSNLDDLHRRVLFVPITSPVMRQAAEFWAVARQRGMPTAADRALDIDMIRAAQTVLIEQEWQQAVVIATTNVRHLARFATAREWREIL